MNCVTVILLVGIFSIVWMRCRLLGSSTQTLYSFSCSSSSGLTAFFCFFLGGVAMIVADRCCECCTCNRKLLVIRPSGTQQQICTPTVFTRRASPAVRYVWLPYVWLGACRRANLPASNACARHWPLVVTVSSKVTGEDYPNPQSRMCTLPYCFCANVHPSFFHFSNRRDFLEQLLVKI